MADWQCLAYSSRVTEDCLLKGSLQRGGQGFEEDSEGSCSPLGLEVWGGCHHLFAWKGTVGREQVLDSRERELNGEDQLASAMVGHWAKKTIREEQVDDHLGLFLLPLHLPPLLLLAEGNRKPRHTGSLTAVLKSVFWTQIRCREVRVHKTRPVPVQGTVQNCSDDVR